MLHCLQGDLRIPIKYMSRNRRTEWQAKGIYLIFLAQEAHHFRPPLTAYGLPAHKTQQHIHATFYKVPRLPSRNCYKVNIKY